MHFLIIIYAHSSIYKHRVYDFMSWEVVIYLSIPEVVAHSMEIMYKLRYTSACLPC